MKKYRIFIDMDGVIADFESAAEAEALVKGVTKLSIVGKLIGRSRGVKSTDIYEAMLQTNYEGSKIIISDIAKMLNVTPRTIYRRLDKYPALKKEKELLNEKI